MHWPNNINFIICYECLLLKRIQFIKHTHFACISAEALFSEWMVLNENLLRINKIILHNLRLNQRRFLSLFCSLRFLSSALWCMFLILFIYLISWSIWNLDFLIVFAAFTSGPQITDERNIFHLLAYSAFTLTRLHFQCCSWSCLFYFSASPPTTPFNQQIYIELLPGLNQIGNILYVYVGIENIFCSWLIITND